MSMPATDTSNDRTLADLLAGDVDIASDNDRTICGIASDSRTVAPGFVFLACAGIRSHGLDYLARAISNGCVAVIYDASTATQLPDVVSVPVIPVDNLALKLGEIANRWYAQPSERLRVLGITGTNGKSTVAWMLAQCLQRLGQPCAYLGTLGSGIEHISPGNGMTTPGAVELQSCLADFHEQGASYAAIEVSSHALVQQRVDGVRFDSAVFTNLSRDHLDYHGDMQAYAQAKARLFLDYQPTHSIINIDTPFGDDLAKRVAARRGDVVVVSTRSAAVPLRHVVANQIIVQESGSDVIVSSSFGDGRLFVPLPGEFNVANALAVLAVLLLQGIDLDLACALLGKVQAPPGRMQKVPTGKQAPAVFVDFAHTPDALDVALRALRDHCRGELCCVFGCGGNRDRGKRAEMGRVVSQLADRVIITNDNPRDENPLHIIDDILAGIDERSHVTVIEDRAASIAWALAQSGRDDVVLIAGKGHESTQTIGDERIAFSDYAVAAANLSDRPTQSTWHSSSQQGRPS